MWRTHRFVGGTVLVGFVIVAATIAFLFRYDTTPMPGGGALVTDRWLGTVSLCVTPFDNVTVLCFPRFPGKTAPKPENSN